MARMIIRGEDGEITHIYYTYDDGWKTFLTQADTDRMMDFSMADIESYFSGEDSKEAACLKDSLLEVLTGDMTIEQLKYKIASQSGLIEDEVVQMNI